MRTLLALFLSGLFLPLYAQQELKLLAPDGAAADEFGGSVSIDGSVLIAGSRLNNDLNITSGTAYVYRQSGNNWIFEQKLTASDADAADHFGVSVDVSGDLAIVGANLDDSAGTDAGAAYIFRYNGSTWVQEKKLFCSDAQPGDEFGYSVSIYDTVAIVGAYRSDFGSSNTGAAYVFHYNGSNWYEAQKITATGASPDDFFGYTVDVHKDRLIAGVYLDDDMGINSGSAYVFRWNGSNWINEQKLTAANGASGDSFGFSVAINDTLCTIGAYGKNVSASASGTVYLFKRTGTTWNNLTQLNAPDGMQDDWFGYSVAIYGNTVIAGAFHDDTNGPESGSFYIFRYNGSSWIYEFNIDASDGNTNDFFAQSVSISGLNVVCGTPNDDDMGSNSGSVYVYPLCTYTPSQELCIASVNSNFSENILIWSKPVTTFIDSFFIYRFDGFSDQLIGSVAYNSPSQFIDNNANINANASSYRISTLNGCTVEGTTGTYHKTIHLIASPGLPGQVDLVWDDQQGITFPYYRIWKDTTGLGNFQLIYATLPNQFTYTDNNLPAGINLDYYIEVVKNGSACNSGSGSRTTAVSNKSNPYTSEISEEENALVFTVYPNPAGELIWIQSEGANLKTTVSVLDINGKLIFTATKKEDLMKIPLADFENGIYLIRLENETLSSVQKFIVLR